MLIQVIDVGTPNTHTAKNGRSYQSVEITYKGDNGQTASKKLMSFSNPEVYKQAATWVKGDAVNINTQKDDAGYWQWIGILSPGESAPVATQTNVATPSTGGGATRVTGSNYPTSDERTQTQGYIIKQSSLSNAVNTLSSGGRTANANEVIALAKVYEGYVLGKEVSVPTSFDDMDDDIPL